jgi:integrase
VLRCSNFCPIWAKVCMTVGVPGLHFHDLRHIGRGQAEQFEAQPVRTAGHRPDRREPELRRGEVFGLAWQDADLADDMLIVGWQLQRIDGQLARVPVKTAAGRRALPLVPIARDALIEQAGRQAAARIRAGTSWAGNDLVFTTRTGQPVEPRNLVRSFERLIDGAGLRKIRLHDLRDTVATLLKTLGVAQRDAMQILGHARISVTLEVYTDSDSDSQRDALTRMSDRLFGPARA